LKLIHQIGPRLTVRAYDLGEPSLHSDVDVTVFVTDENDHAPEFENQFYLVNAVSFYFPSSRTSSIW
jgi:hypothetical protein